jgi:hypothetical protein
MSHYSNHVLPNIPTTTDHPALPDQADDDVVNIFDAYSPADLRIWQPSDEAEHRTLCAAAAAEVGPIVARPAADLAREALANAVAWWNERHMGASSAYAPEWVTDAEAALRSFEAEDLERDRFADEQERLAEARLAQARAAGIDPFA